MLYEKEFNHVKSVYDSLPESQRETAKIISCLPVGAMAIFGLVLVPLGIIGIGAVFLIGLLSMVASIGMMLFCIPFDEETGVPGLKRKLLRKAFNRQPEPGEAVVTLDGQPRSFEGLLPFQLAANDALEQPVSLKKTGSDAA